jgi:hypothetical protein
MRGVYLVASELARLGLITSPTSRSARGADILATTSDCSHAFSVEVKTTTNQQFWMLAEHAKSIRSKSHVFVFVHITQRKNGEEISYYPVVSRFVGDNARLPNPERSASKQYRKGYSIDLGVIKGFKGNWSIFQPKPSAAMPTPPQT